MNDVAPLLSAKLLPPTPGRFQLERPRLLARLRQGLDGRITLIVAGPGHGKSSLASRFLRELEGDWVWCRLDASDRDPWILFRYLIHAVREHAPEFAERSEGIWEAMRGQADVAERAADTFIRDAEDSLTGSMVMVLDGLQALEDDGPCVLALKRLIRYLPGTLHLLLLSRSMPGLGIRPLSADDSVNILHGDELLFTREETARLLSESFGLRVSDETIGRIHERTRGWATALQLLRQTARPESGAAVLDDIPHDVFARTESEIFDYFSEEVLAAEPADVRRFLMEASPLATVDPEICAEALPDLDVPRILERLVRKNLFISSLESRGTLYTFDPLFREFLRRKLKSAAPEMVRDLSQRYARACSRRGEVALALGHWIAADDVRHTLLALGRHGKALLRAGLRSTVEEAARFAARRGSRSPVIDDLLGEISRLAGDHTAAIGHFERALAAAPDGFAALSGPARASTLQGLAYALLKMGHLDRAAQTIDDALTEAGEDDTLRARALNTLSIIRYRQERHDEAVAGWQEALACARLASDAHLTRMIAHNLGLPHAASGDFARASECFQILTARDNPRLGPEEGAAYLNLARIETLRGDYQKASSLLDDAREIARTWSLTGLAADVMEAEANLLRDAGDLDAAAEKYREARARFTELGRPDLIEGLAEEEAALACRSAQLEQAERIASAAVARRRAAGDGAAVASALLALGESRARAGRSEPAIQDLSEAAGVFSSSGRCYQECAAQLWRALAAYRSEGQSRTVDASLARALELSARFDYRALILRVAAVDDAFLRRAASHPAAPAWLREAPSTPIEPADTAEAPLAADAPDLTVRLLGPVEVFRDARRKIPAQAWKIRRSLQLFCFLASSRDGRATKDRIADALWGEARPSVIEKNFHPTVSFLRRALNHGHGVPKNFILYEGGAYQLNPAYRYHLDTAQFEERIRSARRAAATGSPQPALEAYESAFPLYRGPFLEEEYDAWAEAPRRHYESLFLAALMEAAQLHVSSGDTDAGLACLQRLVEHDPLDEEASCRLMRALGKAGHRGGVVKEFERLTQCLRADLSTEPMLQTRKIFDQSLEMASKEVAGKPPKR